MTAADDKDDRDKHVWSVWRQDDNGNRFEVAVNLTRDQAEQREPVGRTRPMWDQALRQR